MKSTITQVIVFFFTLPPQTPFLLYKWGFERVSFTRSCFHDAKKHRLKPSQYEAARLVSGLTRSITINNLMNEIGWLSFSDRRQYQKLFIMYKIQNGMAPDYLCNLLPQIVGQRTTYNLRNAADFYS